MFNNMKNKIREKTGSELPKFSLGQIQQKVGLGRHSRQGSETSLSSIAPEDDVRSIQQSPPPPTATAPPPTPATLLEDPPASPLGHKPVNNELVLADGKSLTPKDLTRLAKREDEWRSRLENRDAEWTTKLERREAELTRLLEDKEREWRKQEQSLTEDLLRSTRELKDALKMAEECKRKMVQHQEDKDQLEGFQNQELAKIKHLLLQKEQENAENGSALKEATALVETLKQEVNRLRPFEEQISNFQAITKSENVDLSEKVIDAEKKCLEYLAENERLTQELMDEKLKSKESMSGSADHNNELLVEQLAQITRELESLKEKNEELEKAAQAIREERDGISLKTAQMSAELKIANQQLEVQQQEYNSLHLRLSEQLSKEAQEQEAHAEEYKKNENSFSHLEQELQATISDLQDQLGDKNKTIRVLQQRIADMKKTLQRELKSSDPGGGGGGIANNASVGNSNASSGEQNHTSNSNQNSGTVPFDNDVNFKYLKHVLIKFLTSREYEAQHLTRAVATLLKFSPEEERLLRDTLEWKMSWFGSRPRLPSSSS